MSTNVTTLPNSPGLSVTAYVQGGASAIGVQQDTKVGILQTVFPTGMTVNPVAVSEEFIAATLPSPAVIYQFTVPNTAGTYELTVPFKCQVIFASGIATYGASGDTIQIKKKDLSSGTVTDISDAIPLGTAANAVFYVSSIDKTGTDPHNVLLPGDNLQAVTVKGGSDCSCLLFVTVIPVV
jgi:hypothetical protein